MKRIFVLLGVSAVLTFSCATTGTVGLVFDDSLPIEQTSQLFCIRTVGKITAYNNIPVTWDLHGIKIIQIPAGDTLLEWDVQTRYANTFYEGSNMLFQYDFQPGKKYYFHFKANNGVYGLNVYVYNYEEKVTDTIGDLAAHRIGFVPFLNAKKANEKTILE